MADFGELSRADLRPMAALRYRCEVAGDLSTVLAPPFDVISAEEHRVLLERSPYNIVRLELPEPVGREAADPYGQAGVTLRSWLARGVLALDAEPGFYPYEQEFEHRGRRLARRVLFGRLRLEPWESGVVRPHELTMRAPKEDRLRLLRATRANISPVFALYRDPEGTVSGLIERLVARQARALAEASTPDGQRHRLSVLSDTIACAALSDAFRRLTLYLADGHHRYETALAYREERRSGSPTWTGEEPENFVLAGLTAAGDPGLLVLPIHRLLSVPPAPGALERLRATFDVEDLGPVGEGRVGQVMSQLGDAGQEGAAFAAVGLEAGRFTLLTLRHPEKLQALFPAAAASAGVQVDAAALRYAVLERGLGLAAADLDDGSALAYSEEAEFAVGEVLAGRRSLAFLLNPTPVERILSIADAGERLPQKSTYFYPKLPAGLVLNPLE